MLDTETKRRINTCRDILVGKVPDPKSQVEQITIALIYKFMDDMDLEAEEMGFARKFFTGEYERYAWAKLVAPSVGGQEMLNTYTEALTKMVQNPDIPELFRSIFRNAYLPYRDPETLRSFLREINGFSYDHSERLGDAFEYLLSVLGSQGDAGQFRTPRHIIDFMVEIIDPKKEEVILDPACGTAGFLISSYKHILKANSTDADRASSTQAEVDAAEAALESPLRFSGDLLTPEDRQRLANQIKGYDISPDMVRLSLVNLYLHGFADPKVEEYDTLTSEDKWGQTADVILANPPFMSPKGGIKPHNRFGVPSKRSEVLFVDYIAEHLTPSGRAAIVVPEGIIFQSQSAYCDLRRMLVDKYLVAVISLPAGVFNPYSGVKTSILILDRKVAKISDSIAFFKIENDGFGLGAQRRAMKGSQLAQVKAELGSWLEATRSNGDPVLELSLGFEVQKARIAEDEGYNLSGERYRETDAKATVWPLRKIADFCKTGSGGTPATNCPEFYVDGTIPWLTSGEVSAGEIFSAKTLITQEALDNSSARLFPPNSVLVAMYGATAGEVGLLRFPAATNQAICALLPNEKVSPEFLYYILRHNKPLLIRYAGGGAQPNISQKIVREIEIPLPPLEVQREIVAEIEGYKKVIDGACTVLKNYRPCIPVDPAWAEVPFAEVCTLEYGAALPTASRRAGQVPVMGSNGVSGYHDEAMVLGPAIIVGRKGSAGEVNWVEQDCFPIDTTYYVKNRDPSKASLRFLYFSLQAMNLPALRGGTGIPGLNRNEVYSTKVFTLPPLETQKAIVAEIEAEQMLVDANRELIARFENKIEASIARVWSGAEEAVAA